MGNTPLRLAGSVLTLIAAAALAADTSPAKDAPPAAQVAKSSAPAPTAADKSAETSCIHLCTTKDAQCGSDVRRARQECSRNAANGGRDPMTMRRNGYAYFCGHFLDPSAQCGANVYTSGCTARYQLRYGVCIDEMAQNIAAMRYDCYKAERDATRMCRDELQDCKRACGAQ